MQGFRYAVRKLGFDKVMHTQASISDLPAPLRITKLLTYPASSARHSRLLPIRTRSPLLFSRRQPGSLTLSQPTKTLTSPKSQKIQIVTRTIVDKERIKKRVKRRGEPWHAAETQVEGWRIEESYQAL